MISEIEISNFHIFVELETHIIGFHKPRFLTLFIQNRLFFGLMRFLNINGENKLLNQNKSMISGRYRA